MAPRSTTWKASAWKPLHEHEQELTRYAMQALGDEKGITIIGPDAEKRGGVVSFSMEGIHPHDVAQILDTDGIAVRAGHHCAMPLHQHLEFARNDTGKPLSL